MAANQRQSKIAYLACAGVAVLGIIAMFVSLALAEADGVARFSHKAGMIAGVVAFVAGGIGMVGMRIKLWLGSDEP